MALEKTYSENPLTLVAKKLHDVPQHEITQLSPPSPTEFLESYMVSFTTIKIPKNKMCKMIFERGLFILFNSKSVHPQKVSTRTLPTYLPNPHLKSVLI